MDVKEQLRLRRTKGTERKAGVVGGTHTDVAFDACRLLVGLWVAATIELHFH